MTEREHRLMKFHKAWLDRIDIHGRKIGKWCVKGEDDYTSSYLFLPMFSPDQQ